MGHDTDEIIAMHTDQDPAGETDEGEILLGVFCHAFGDRVVLLLGGYEKAAAPADRTDRRD